MPKQNGYTLIELMICIIIICIVVGILLAIAFTAAPLTTALKVLGIIALVLLILRLL